MNDAIKMQISAFVDGELPQNEAELLLRRLCQDRNLRQQAAEYLAVGRVIRGERVVAGMAALREQIAAHIDESGFEDTVAGAESKGPRLIRPVAGIAIAATVAIVALVGLQQVSTDPGVTEQGAATAGVADSGYTVPSAADELLQDYARSHNASASYIGANSINPRLVNYEVPDELPADDKQEEAVEAIADDAETANPAP